MNAPLASITPASSRRRFPRVCLNGRSQAPRPRRHPQAVQLIYAHLPPLGVLAAEHHLRAQTQIEQRAQQLWFAGLGRPAAALNDWLRAEREVVNELCAAFLHRNLRPPEPAANLH